MTTKLDIIGLYIQCDFYSCVSFRRVFCAELVSWNRCSCIFVTGMHNVNLTLYTVGNSKKRIHLLSISLRHQ